MQLAFYKGRWTLNTVLDDPLNYLAHLGICTFTWSKYSHVELVIDGVCWSSKARENGVRGKKLVLASSEWDVYEVKDECDQAAALKWFQDHNGLPYDWVGCVRFLLPFVKQRPNEYFCSEAVAAALGDDNPSKERPKDLFKYVKT